MICPICKQRWAPLEKEGVYSDPTSSAREEAFNSNEIQCCTSPNCEVTTNAYLYTHVGKSYDEMVEETKKALNEGKIK